MATYAISDIHGCLKTFRSLLENGIKLRKTDNLYLLGDYVNKGPDSKGVLDYMLSLKESGFNVFCLRGNHDQLLLDAIDIGKGAIWLAEADCQTTLKNFGAADFSAIEEKYIRFIRSMPLFVLLDSFALVHAGCDFTYPQEALFNDPYTLMNIKEFEPDRNKLRGRILLHGHKPVAANEIQNAVLNQLPAVNIDAGCVYYKNPDFGNLAAFNLDAFSVHFQPNCEALYSINLK